MQQSTKRISWHSPFFFGYATTPPRELRRESSLPAVGAVCDRPYRSAVSELESQRELNLAAVSVRSRAGNGTRRRADVRAPKHNEIGGIEVRVIQNVEDLRSELQIQSLFQTDPFKQRRIHVEEARSPELAAPHVAEGSRHRQREGVRIVIAAGLLEFLYSQNRVSFEVGIPAWPIGKATSVARTGPIRANLRRNGKAAIGYKDAVPLPTADQLVHPTRSSAAERLAVPERQLIAEVRIELVQEAEGGGSLVEPPIEAIQSCGSLIIGAVDEVRGIDVQHLSPGVAGLERQSAARALEQRETHRMVAAGADIVPALAGAEQRVRTQVLTTVAPWDVQRSLRNVAWRDAWGGSVGRGENAATVAALGVPTHQRLNRVYVHCCRHVI